jgi:alkyl sulfatase BDS1-like metallo-beta-lactamase superfamily hydrolase
MIPYRKLCTGLAMLIALAAAATQAADVPSHFDPQGQPPSKFTLELRNGLRATLPFADKRDFDEANKGFIAAPPYKQIMADAGHVAWDMASYQWLLTGQDFATIHPSLQRQAVLNMNYGLYEVVPGRIYQVRGFDLANISFIKGDTGWIVFDPLTAAETARAALQLVNERLGKRPVVAVVYSHSHGDHFGGVRGVVDEADVASGKVMVIAPEGFMEAAISENVFAGNAMTRRLQWQYAVLLPRGPFGHVDQAIGKNIASGSVGLIAPNRIIKDDFEEITLDGVKMVFQNTPDTEAPVEMNTWFPQFKAFWAAENVTGTIHNIYTLRGAAVRNAINWSKQIDVALHRFGGEADVMFASHSWPRWGTARIQEVMRTQRDAYANLNNQTLHYVNQGVTINEIHNVYQVPKSLQQQWAARSYHGDVQNNVRGVVNRFIGHFDGNPANLIPLSPADSAPLYVEMMGGSEKIIARGEELVAQGKYLHAAEILNRLLFAEPRNQAARRVLANAFEQLGYQAESTSVRNTFLQGAFELRNGLPGGLPPRSTGPDVVRAMSTGHWLDFLGISMDPKKAEGARYTVNLVTPDNGEKYAVELSNATLTNIEGF